MYHLPVVLSSFFPAGAQTFKQVHIEIAQDSIDELESHPYTNEDVRGSFMVDTLSWESVDIHYRGAYNLWQLIQKGTLRNWKIKTSKTEKLENRREWNFNYENYIRQNLAYHMFREAGVPCVSSENVILTVNGERQGLYLKYEDPDNKDWLAEVFGDDEGDLYKAAFDMPDQEQYFADLTYLGDNDEDYFLHYRKQTNKKGEKEFDYSSIRSFISFINHTSDEEFEAAVEDNFAIDKFIEYLVVSNFVANWDGYPFRPKNYFLYNNPADQKWHFIPWDLDGTFQEVGVGRNPIGTTGSVFHYFDGPEPYNANTGEPRDRPLVWRLMAIEKYRNQFIYEYKLAMESLFTVSHLNGVIDSMTAGVEANTHGQELEDYLRDVGKTRDFIETRYANVTAELAQYEVENPYLIAVSGVSIFEDSVTLLEGNMVQMTSLISPEDADDKRVSWSSTDSTIARVDGEGMVEAIATGSATVTITTLDGGFSDSCLVTVIEEASTGITAVRLFEMLIYPNPATTQIRLKLPNQETGEGLVQIINLMGQTLLSQSIHINSEFDTSMIIDIEHIPAGQYMIVVKSMRRNYYGRLLIME